MTLLHQACEKQCQLEQELAFYKIDLKFDRLGEKNHEELIHGVGLTIIPSRFFPTF